MAPRKKTQQMHETHSVATAATTLETPASPDPVPKSPKRKRIPTVTTSLLGALSVPATPVSQTPASTVVTVTSTTPATGTTTSSASSASTPTSPAAPGAVSPPPAAQVPAPPVGFSAPGPRAYSGYYPSAKELAAAPTAVTDLQTFVDYAERLGSAAPASNGVAQAIQVAIQWRAMRAPAEAWDAYVRAENGMAWKAALTLLDELKPLFLNAVAKDASLALTYQGLAAMLDAPKQLAAKAVATKKKNAKAKGSAAGPATPAAGASTAESAATAAPSATAPTKTVTVTL